MKLDQQQAMQQRQQRMKKKLDRDYNLGYRSASPSSQSSIAENIPEDTPVTTLDLNSRSSSHLSGGRQSPAPSVNTANSDRVPPSVLRSSSSVNVSSKEDLQRPKFSLSSGE